MPSEVAAPTQPAVSLIVLRHGHIASHRGDVPLTEDGRNQAASAGRWFADQQLEFVSLLASPTNRTVETAECFRRGFLSDQAGVTAVELSRSAALRNPDLYLGGQLVNMVSSPEAFVAQAPALTPQDVLAAPFFSNFLTDPDRIGYWLGHGAPPGDTALAVGRRIEVFVRSLAQVPQWAGRTVVGITHSPVLRAIALTHLGADPGEPKYLHGYRLTVQPTGALHVDTVEPTTDTPPGP